MDNVKFEKMMFEHLDQVILIENISFPTPWSKNAFDYELTYNDFAHYIVALNDDNQVIGYAGVWIILDEGHITNIAIHPGWRSTGLGFTLMQELISRAALLGVERFTLEVRPSNKPARALYQKLGFVEKGLRKQYYTDTKEDAIIMWMDLSSHSL
ncbi:[SSU ribosomal protein S18P]-alanine acetyltransferase [Desulfotomaculum arcticum]|uniref:[Ribosomal protein bS18]-alanine N-acetyltransferase n=1 Tax=Desulfotruncus arcticus DSM 17038 TaxID=1121424 RepID=A0A1I2N590_9FIRM|nr:ribosomal protein S18-alanine N-acetyltransferase [Desulfotruncus arcticus]SFF98793.1 [SSU ribosomal protein S18P]-alanine acetyltransferase [Desulfotomaculum arcticum] [Desulfotruncus arcticus DSM 17038]